MLYTSFDSVDVDQTQLGNDGGADQPMFDSQFHLLSVGKDKLVQIEKDEFQRLRANFVGLNDLSDH
jgi:hypothetical protein